MTTVALTSVRGAPGVTTTSLLLASVLKGSVLVEADLTGGVVAVRPREPWSIVAGEHALERVRRRAPRG